MTKEYPCGIIVPDIHLREDVPRARKEKSWYPVMSNYLSQLKDWWAALGKPPIFYPGDIFHKPEPSPELINFALAELPNGYAIPGQHDLLHHNYLDMHKTAYATLVRAGKLIDCKSETLHTISHLDTRMLLCGFPWGHNFNNNWILGTANEKAFKIRIAMSHEYVWQGEQKYHGAEEEKADADSWKVATRFEKMGFTHAFTGDNHKGFHLKGARFDLFNAGGFIRTNADQRYYMPACGILYSNGNMSSYYWSINKDQWHSVESGTSVDYEEKNNLDLKKLISELLKGVDSQVRFFDTVKRAAEQHGEEVRNLLARIQAEVDQ